MILSGANMIDNFLQKLSKLPWRNWLARSTVNRKVGGSSPPGSGVLSRHMWRSKMLQYRCHGDIQYRPRNPCMLH